MNQWVQSFQAVAARLFGEPPGSETDRSGCCKTTILV